MKAVVGALLVLLLAGADAFSGGFAGQAVARRGVTATSTLSMKVFDWKRREDDSYRLDLVKDGGISQATLFPSPGSRHRKKRKGRGIAAGQGASCGFGMRGQKSRSGPGVRAGFEGGQQPLYRRLPKLVGRPTGPGHTKKEFTLISLDALNSAAEGSTVSFVTLQEQGVLSKSKHRWQKVVGSGDLSVSGLTVQAHAFTESAKAAIEAKGGSCQLLSPTTHEAIDMSLLQEA